LVENYCYLGGTKWNLILLNIEVIVKFEMRSVCCSL